MFSRINPGLLINLQSTFGRDCNPFLGTFLQSVRWARKPIWAPVAKSKLFRIPERKKLPEDEALELRRLYNEYRTHCKAVRQLICKEYAASVEESPSVINSRIDDDLSQAIKLNEEWNKEVAAIREERLTLEAEIEREKNLQYMIRAEQENEEQIKLLDEIVKAEKEKSTTFITPDNLDEAIEFALANPVDYNFAIDLKGNIVYGRKGKFEEVLMKQVEELNEKQVAASSS
ncbi:hypothetical protein J437_LFUL003376 [Ladona fulva]|uniref:Small ribosomal subunit protein mS26 n=1 Tax=Ladona fulva TaxID=123851 RepID=A0A8K0JT76_LADFU|nr:hypothetical protein J437_LFUL003376 [Ladona fulva]